MANSKELFEVNMESITVVDQMQCIKLLSSKLRDKSTGYKDYMIYADRLTTILAEEALARVPAVVPKQIETPCGVFDGLEDREDQQLCVVSIIRSGDILLEAVRKLTPGIRVGKILIQRDEETEDKRPIYFYKKLPADIADCYILLVDPMLGTGGSAVCATEALVVEGVKPENIMFVNLFSCREGLSALLSKFPEMKVVTLSMDDTLNEDMFLVPGLGDFGDRYYGTNHK